MNYRANVSCVDKWRPVSTLLGPVCPDRNKVKVSCLHQDSSWTSSYFKFILSLIEERTASSEWVLLGSYILYIRQCYSWTGMRIGRLVPKQCTPSVLVKACDDNFQKISGGCFILETRIFVHIPRPLFCGGCTLFSAFPKQLQFAGIRLVSWGFFISV